MRPFTASFIAALVAAFVALAPADVSAAGLAKAASGSLAKRAAQGAPVARAKPPHDVIVHRTQHPEAAAHVEHAQAAGQPTILEIDRRGAAQRRTESTGPLRTKPSVAGLDRDEYPPAFTREGGQSANVRFISPHDNRGAGAALGAQIRDLPDGSRIRMLVTD